MRFISRTKIEHILSLVLNGINMSLCLLVIVACVFKSINGSFSEIVICIYGGIIAALCIINEAVSFDISFEYFRFLSIYRGRSMVFIFFGCLVLDNSVVNIVAGTLNLTMGSVYMIMSFITPAFVPPNPVSINWQNWKDFSAEGLDLPRPRPLGGKTHQPNLVIMETRSHAAV
ncbi:hypothetical protein BX666DRAFT_1894554 [Dichotomocladium elegans]|nr:hypothetical protein BX666DRAFT_1894554 [Dichotomocladium elegans]